jgi:acyl carrier protein
MNEYIKRIIAIIIEKTGIDPEDITESSYFEEDLNIDELELMDIIAIIEEEYDIIFEPEEKERITSVMDIVEFVVEKIE